MNAPTIIKDQRPGITVADLFHMMERGVIDPEARFELVEGEIVHMSPQGPLHQDLQRWLERQLYQQIGNTHWVTGGSTLILPQGTALDPDICVYPLDLKSKDLSGDKATLVIEVSVSSKRYHLGRKASLYAAMGVPELWVIDAAARETHVHRKPDDGVWSEIVRVPADGVLQLAAAPALNIRLADAG